MAVSADASSALPPRGLALGAAEPICRGAGAAAAHVHTLQGQLAAGMLCPELQSSAPAHNIHVNNTAQLPVNVLLEVNVGHD